MSETADADTDGAPDERITIYSDYVCPFCYLGRRSLDNYQETRDAELAIDWQPYDLRGHKRGPDGEIDDSVDDGKDDEYFDQVRENVARLREEYEAEEMLGIDEVPDVDSLDAQVASLYVRETQPEEWLAFDEALFEALWVEGRDIGDRDVIAEIAEDVGLDGEEVRAAVDDEDLRAEIREQIEAARQEGITGVPTFVYGEYAARGAVPPAHIERLVEGV